MSNRFSLWLLAGLVTGTLGASAQKLPQPIQLSAGWELQDSAKVTQSGDVISCADYQPAQWYKATVPGTVLTSLVKDKVYPDPLYGENNRPDKISDSLCRTAYWYRTPFTLPESYSGKRVWLNFNGINYMADVWVNGHQVGSINGAFSRGIFDVTPFVTVGTSNALAVQILPQPHPGATHEKTMATGTGLNGGSTAADGPSFMCSIGWDWIPTIRDRDMGIWQDVTLSATGPVVVQDPSIDSRLPLPRTDSADVTVQATVHNATDQAQTGTLTGSIEGDSFKQEVTLQPNETQTVTFTPANFPVLHFSNPRLWWPNGYGPQNLYKLRFVFSVEGKISDARDVTFGVRQISYTLPGSDNLALSVNGVPVMAKGGDWGMDEAMKRIPRERLEAEIRMHKLANYTIIRNWVGQSTSEDFYDLCDRYGLLVWDEFFQPNPLDGPNPENAELYLANVKDKILRFRNHPSIALWCARNEGDPPAAIGDGIQKLINALDSHRLYHPNSADGRGVRSGGPYFWRTPREFYNYDEAFKSEIGSMSVPTLEAIHAMMPSKDWETINDDWAEHDFCSGAQAGDRYPVIITGRYGPVANLPDFVRKAQLANYECYRAMYEGRFSRLFRPSTGVITWMSNPAQPSFVWQLYSHDLEPNAALYGARQACEPVHIQMNQNDWHVMVVNNTDQALNGLIAATMVYNLDGKLQYTHTQEVNAAASAATDTGVIAFPAGLSPVHFVKVELRQKDRLLSGNFYWRAMPDDPDNFQTLNNLPTVALDIQAKRHNKVGTCRLDVVVRNPSSSIALMTHLQLRKAASGQRVLPVFYSDNYISLLPGESRTLSIETAVTNLAGETPLLAVDGWNVTVNPTSSKAVQVAVNNDACVHNTPVPVDFAPNLKINCGGGQVGFFCFGQPIEEYIGDFYANHGSTASTTNTIDASTLHAAPVSVYQSERWGDCTYTLPVQKNHAYTVRLHFAETKFDPSQRKFNVDINSHRELSDFDIAAEGGKNKAVVKEFASVHPNADGKIVIELTRGSADQPKICGIELVK